MFLVVSELSLRLLVLQLDRDHRLCHRQRLSELLELDPDLRAFHRRLLRGPQEEEM